MAFSFELKLAISSELFGAISAGPEQSDLVQYPNRKNLIQILKNFLFET